MSYTGYPNYIPGFNKAPTQAADAQVFMAAPQAWGRAPQPRQVQVPAFQVGRKTAPARVTRCGWPTDQGKKTLGGLIVLSDEKSIEAIKQLETQVTHLYPGAQLNSNFTKYIEDENKLPVPIVRVKFGRNPEGLSVMEYGACGDDQPVKGPPQEQAEMRNGHLIVAMATPRPWQRDGKCGVTLYLNKVNCLGFQEQGPGAYQGAAEPVWE